MARMSKDFIRWELEMHVLSMRLYAVDGVRNFSFLELGPSALKYLVHNTVTGEVSKLLVRTKSGRRRFLCYISAKSFERHTI